MNFWLETSGDLDDGGICGEFIYVPVAVRKVWLTISDQASHRQQKHLKQGFHISTCGCWA